MKNEKFHLEDEKTRIQEYKTIVVLNEKFIWIQEYKTIVVLNEKWKIIFLLKTLKKGKIFVNYANRLQFKCVNLRWKIEIAVFLG